jgi:hypothetical protein
VATSGECNEAWKKGFINGYKSLKGTTPSIPTRPGSIPSGVTNSIEYFYGLGYNAGMNAASR